MEEKLERDEIEVGRDEGMFRAIKLEVRDADVEILKVRVVRGHLAAEPPAGGARRTNISPAWQNPRTTEVMT